MHFLLALEGFLEFEKATNDNIVYAEAEYIAVANSATHALWLCRMLDVLQHKQVYATKIYYVSKSTIELSNNPLFHMRSKYIDVKYYLISYVS